MFRYEREEAFTSISVDVRSHNNLLDSMKEYVKGDLLDNDNAYLCEQCDKKVCRSGACPRINRACRWRP